MTGPFYFTSNRDSSNVAAVLADGHLVADGHFSASSFRVGDYGVGHWIVFVFSRDNRLIVFFLVVSFSFDLESNVGRGQIQSDLRSQYDSFVP